MSSLRIIFLLSFLSLSFSAQAQDAGAETAAESETGKKAEEGIKDLPRVSTAPSAQKKTDEKKTDEKKVDEKEADAEPELLNGVQDDPNELKPEDLFKDNPKEKKTDPMVSAEGDDEKGNPWVGGLSGAAAGACIPTLASVAGMVLTWNFFQNTDINDIQLQDVASAGIGGILMLTGVPLMGVCGTMGACGGGIISDAEGGSLALGTIVGAGMVGVSAIALLTGIILSAAIFSAGGTILAITGITVLALSLLAGPSAAITTAIGSGIESDDKEYAPEARKDGNVKDIIFRMAY